MKFSGNKLLKFTGDFTVIDLETTGRTHHFEDVTELSAVRFRKGVEVASYSTLIKAVKPILPYVVNLTGITDSMLADAPKIGTVIQEFVEFIGDDVILGHNVTFDYSLVYDAYLSKSGNRMNNDYIDTLQLSRILNKDSLNHKLGTLCEYFDVQRLVGHRGLADSRQTAEIYLKMWKKYVKNKVEGKNERI